MIEDGAYTRLCDVYYTREKPLPADIAECCRIARAFIAAERNAVKSVLGAFFTLQVDGWHHKRIDEEIAKVQSKSQKARASANSRWQSNGHANGHANASGTHMRNGCETDALQSPVPNLQSPVSPTLPSPDGGGAVFETRTRKDRKAEAELAWKRLVNSEGELGMDDLRVQHGVKAAGGLNRINMRRSGIDDASLRGAFVAAFLGAQT